MCNICRGKKPSFVYTQLQIFRECIAIQFVMILDWVTYVEEFYDGIEEILTVLIVHEATNLRMVNITFGKCKAPSTFHGTINTMLMP
jgi:hypothetical protein